MHSFATSLSLLVLGVTPSIFAAPSGRTAEIQALEGEIVQGSYIVKLKDGANKENIIDTLEKRLNTNFELTHDYDPEFFNAFSGYINPTVLEEIAANPSVEYISEDGLLRANADTRTNAPWGLQRVSHIGALPQGSNPNNLVYKYDFPENIGQGVNVYVVDTGINTAHVNFNGRATFGYSALDQTEDGNGHGTHCAGTAVGSLYGVARNAKVIAVKVLSDAGSGSTSDIIAGLNWVVAQYKANRIPAVISMSLGGSANTPLDNAVTAAVKAGVHTVVAAGNNGQDASRYSPARAPRVITVGATTIGDIRASFSNYGRVVDIWAPGQNVISSWIGSTTAINNISGTSMATPHVAGVLASLITQYGNMPPDQLTSVLLRHADRSSTGLPMAQLSHETGSTSSSSSSSSSTNGVTPAIPSGRSDIFSSTSTQEE